MVDEWTAVDLGTISEGLGVPSARSQTLGPAAVEQALRRVAS